MRDVVARSVARNFFEGVEFMPGSRFVVEDDLASANGLVTVRLLVPVPDAYHPEATRIAYATEDVPTVILETRSDRVLPQLAHDLAWGHVLHEAGEWLRIDGHRPFDPHGPNALR